MRRLLSIGVLWCLTGCGPELGSQMLLSGYRVLGIEASPPEVRSDGSVTLSAVDYYDGEQPVNYRWSLCLHSYGTTADYECVDGDLEFALSDERELSVDFGPNGLDLASYLPTLLEYPDAEGEQRSLERGLDVWLRLQSGPDCRSCEIDTVKRLTIRDSPQRPNANPVIREFSVGSGRLRRGATVTLEVTTDEPETFTTPGTDAEAAEQYLYSWYTNAGETKPTRSFGEERRTDLVLPDEPGPVFVSVTVRDGRGGFTSAEMTLDVE